MNRATIDNTLEQATAAQFAVPIEQSDNFIVEWFEETLTENDRYTHRLLRERGQNRERIKDKLKERVQRAHEDARRSLRRVAEETLDPLGQTDCDPAQGYPELLPLTTVKGYFGEVFAAIIAEEFSHFGRDDWTIPAYPFRFHQTAFDFLEALRQGASVPRAVFGRTGDDMLAFTREPNGKISRSLVCEAKCTDDHNTSMIADAHRKASAQLARPVEIRRLLEILKDYEDGESDNWRKALTLLYISDDLSEYERCDLVCYTCGRPPKQGPTWIPNDSPHPEYQGRRQLESVEIHLSNVDNLIREIYGIQEVDQ